MPPGIQRIYMEIAGKLVNLPIEITAVLPISMEENQRLSLSFLYVMVLNVQRQKDYSPMVMMYSLMNEAPGIRWLMKGFSLNSPLKPRGSPTPYQGSRQTKGAFF